MPCAILKIILTTIFPSGIWPDYLHIERSYLYRLFKNFTGVSLQEYLLDYRMRRACSLLTETDLSVGDISRSVGYGDALYFSRIFRQKKGMTPTQFRKARAHSIIDITG